MATTMKLIAKNVLGSSASSVTFSDIPGTYTDLLLLVSARVDAAGDGNLYGRFNGDTGSNYSRHLLYGVGSTAASVSASSQTSMPTLAYGCFSGNTSNTFGSSETLIPNYGGSTAKSVSATICNETNSTTDAYVGAAAGLWSGTAAITSISLAAPSGSNILSGSSFFLYGITKA